MQGTRARAKWLALAAAVLLAGCAVKPKPLAEAELSHLAGEKLAKVTADQEPIGGAIDLYEAMARALKYNLDFRVESYEKALRSAELDLSHYKLLPKIVGNAGFTRRNRFEASSSFNLLSQTSNFGASTSREKHLRDRDLEISWDILDFGLSYVRARQTADKVLIAAGEQAQGSCPHYRRRAHGLLAGDERRPSDCPGCAMSKGGRVERLPMRVRCPPSGALLRSPR